LNELRNVGAVAEWRAIGEVEVDDVVVVECGAAARNYIARWPVGDSFGKHVADYWVVVGQVVAALSECGFEEAVDGGVGNAG